MEEWMRVDEKNSKVRGQWIGVSGGCPPKV